MSFFHHSKKQDRRTTQEFSLLSGLIVSTADLILTDKMSLLCYFQMNVALLVYLAYKYII